MPASPKTARVGAAPAAPDVAPADRTVPTALRFDKTPLRDVAAALTKAAGVAVTADSASGAVPVTLDTAPGARLGTILEQVARSLPEGSTLRLVAVPGGPAASPDGDAVARYLAAQTVLRPMASKGQAEKPVAGGIEVMGRALPFGEAAPVLATLELRPVYLIANPKAENPVAKMSQLESDRMQVWMGMTPEQRKQAVDASMSALFNMDANARQALFGQMQEQASAMMQKIQSMPADQRAQFFRDLTGGKWDGMTPPPGRGGQPQQP